MNEGAFDFTELVSPGRNRMDELRVGVGALWGLRHTIPASIDDLLDVAMAIYAADRLVRRGKGESAWLPRTLHLKVPVSNPDRWNDLKAAHEELLGWLTSDEWDIEFVAGVTRQRSRPAYALLPTTLEHPFVALYSGGLDSLAGAVAQSLNPKYNAAVLVGGQSGKVFKSLQEKQHSDLRANLKHIHWEDMRGFSHPYKKGSLAPWNVPEKRQEKSQRSRAFLFLAFGAVTAYAYGVDTLHVYENGVGAVNLPYTAAFGGADMTRAMHPKTLLLAGRLFGRILDRPFTIANPSLWLTKGEMCAQLARAGLADLANGTVSCDSFPLREFHKQCGLCTSCLLRRLSLHAAGLRELDQGSELYRDDIYVTAAESQDKALHPYFFMVQQAQTLKKVTRSDDLLDFSIAFDELDEARYAITDLTGMEQARIDAELTSLYRRYAGEVLAFHDALTGSNQKEKRHDEELQRARRRVARSAAPGRTQGSQADAAAGR